MGGGRSAIWSETGGLNVGQLAKMTLKQCRSGGGTPAGMGWRTLALAGAGEKMSEKPIASRTFF